MTRKSPRRRPCAAQYVNQIEFAASPPWALLGFLWLGAVAAVILSSPLPGLLRVALALLLGLPVRSWWRFALLGGPRAVRALRWSRAGQYQVRLAGSGWWPATAVDLCRYGAALGLLYVSTPEGRVGLLVDARRQPVLALRRLYRSLEHGCPQSRSDRGSGRPGLPS